jgi:hypothetical protein
VDRAGKEEEEEEEEEEEILDQSACERPSQSRWNGID